jgi:hypothetical protein
VCDRCVEVWEPELLRGAQRGPHSYNKLGGKAGNQCTAYWERAGNAEGRTSTCLFSMSYSICDQPADRSIKKKRVRLEQ